MVIELTGLVMGLTQLGMVILMVLVATKLPSQ